MTQDSKAQHRYSPNEAAHRFLLDLPSRTTSPLSALIAWERAFITVAHATRSEQIISTWPSPALETLPCLAWAVRAAASVGCQPSSRDQSLHPSGVGGVGADTAGVDFHKDVRQ
jgi:hypothetical protein